ncbi:hypothetical protein AJ80_09066 [Polytolypa hystricis UAMH7299]|uniref:RRM domain-containing protein n=1 Tax=Polytolypa hystricis (strain UAMH7299) TaxID=1447883 RepID=A0A2B7WWW7_POLH7|nr:hypothetical protein AJ80_09066 [Polytolypa hystricis UAMH7299]
MPLRIDDAMIEILAKLNLITEHLRKHNLDASANQIAKGTHEIVGGFTDAMLTFSDHDLVVADQVPPALTAANLAEPTLTVAPKNKHVASKAAEGPLIEETDDNSKEENKVDANDLICSENTWARVAATAAPITPLPNAANKPVKSEYPQTSTHKLPATELITTSPGSADAQEPVEQKAGCVVVAGTFRPGSLNHLTSKISEGPLFSVDVGYNTGYAKIMFQHASDAVAFIEADKEEVSRNGHGCFGPGYRIVGTEALNWNNELRRMIPPLRERRRLTFARAGLLGPGLTFKQFQADLVKVAGKDGIDIVWAFNAGNATVIFKSVAVARAVRNHFLHKATHAGPYKGVTITYSTDPCEKQLVLATQFNPRIAFHRMNAK